MTTPEARRAALQEALLTGAVVRARLLETLDDLDQRQLLATDDRVGQLGKEDRRLTDSLALTFGNLVGIVQDQIVRLVLLIEELDVGGMSRREQRLRAESLGLLAPELRFDRVVEMRNRIAHQYPRDPERQRRLLTDIAAQSRSALAAYDSVRRYAEDRILDHPLEPER